MITLFIASLIAALIYFLWRDDRGIGRVDRKNTNNKVTLGLLIGLLTIVALFYPQIRNKIHDLQQRRN